MAGKRLIFIGALFIILIAPVSAANVESVDVSAGVIWIGNTGENIAPSPLTSILAVSFPIRLASVLLLVPELGYFGGPYGIDNNRIVPVEIEFKDSVYMTNFIVSPRLVLAFNLGSSFIIGASLSPSVVARAPTFAWGEGETQRMQITEYFYSSGRFFLPEAGLFFDWAVPYKIEIPGQPRDEESEEETGEPESSRKLDIHLAFGIRGYFPVYHFWDGENLPFHDQLMISGTAILRFFLHPQASDR